MDAFSRAPEKALSVITERARQRFDTHGVSINLLLDDRQRTFIGTQGDGVEVPFSESFCRKTIESDRAVIISDAWSMEDEDVPKNDLRFYAGYPIHSTTGVRIGTICVWDHHPRATDLESAKALRDFAIEIEKELATASLV